MCASGGHVRLALGGHDDTVGVDKEVVLQDVGDRHGSQLEVFSLGGDHFSRFGRDDSSVGVFNKAILDVGSHRLSRLRSRLGRSSHRMDRSSRTVGMVDRGSCSVACGTCGLVESSLGGGDSRCVGGNHSAVGVMHKVSPA